MPKDMYYGSKMMIYNHNGKTVEGIYINQINEILASTKVPNENLVFIENYANILNSINEGKILEIRKKCNRTIATIQKHDAYYKNKKIYEARVEGQDFFEVLNELDEKLEKNIVKPKIYQKIFNGFFKTKKY